MKIELIDTIADATTPGQVVEIEGPVSITEILLYYKGTNQDGKTAAAEDDLGGNLMIKEVGVGRDILSDIVSLSRPQFLITYWEAFFGYLPEESVDDGDYRYVLPVPFHVGKYDYNSLYIPPNFKLQIQVPAMDEAGANIDNCSCSVYARTNKRYATRYVPRLFQQRVDLAAQQREGIPEGTAVAIATAASTTEANYLRFLKGTDRLIDMPTDAAYHLYQVIEHMEAAPTMTGDIVFDFTDMGNNLSEVIGSDHYFETVDGAGYLELFTFGLDLHHPARFAASRNYVGDGIAESRRSAERSGIVPEMHAEQVEPAPPARPRPVAIGPTGSLEPVNEGVNRSRANARRIKRKKLSMKNALQRSFGMG